MPNRSNLASLPKRGPRHAHLHKQRDCCTCNEVVGLQHVLTNLRVTRCLDFFSDFLLWPRPVSAVDETGEDGTLGRVRQVWICTKEVGQACQKNGRGFFCRPGLKHAFHRFRLLSICFPGKVLLSFLEATCFLDQTSAAWHNRRSGSEVETDSPQVT